jgi:dihydroflavonol-4-reductase
MGGTKLVMGASGFVGSHVTRQLVERGDNVRVWVRASSSTRAFDQLDVERHYGDLTDDDKLREAMTGVDAVHYCIVDPRAHLRDPAPLFQTNVEGLRHALDAAVATGVARFIFCSTIGTIAVTEGATRATEDLPHNWAHLGGPYIRARVGAENLVLEYVRDRGLPAVIMNVSTPFGPYDYGPTQHGAAVDMAARGKMPVYVRNQYMEMVGIEDVARAFLLAEERGRVGERYIISERFMSSQELFTTAAEAVGAKPPKIGVPLAVMGAFGTLGDALGRVTGKDYTLTRTSVRLMHIMSPADHSKATRELGWEPGPTPDAVRRAAQFYVGQPIT